MRIIDSHVHLYSPEINADPARWAEANGEGHWATLCTRKRSQGKGVQEFPSVDELLRRMDADGVERAILLGWYWERVQSVETQNQFLRSCAQAHPDRLSACASWHPELAVEPFVRSCCEEGFVGLGELSPHTQGMEGLGQKWEELFIAAGQARLPINLHVTEPESGQYPGKIETPLEDFLRWAERVPAACFIWAHWGARIPLTLNFAARAKALSNVSYDTAASPLIYRKAAIWPQMVEAVGAGRVLFGTDFPLVLYPRREPQTAGFGELVREAQGSGLSMNDQRAIFAENARRLWRLT